ncbi:Transmembrane protein [Orchesella cincta]|uniref:Transmembrane protein n=1 Tax=Orchesella cincta TaxID=48709 RepID=A0A1D2M5R9_ORCCI|nr:Transmembrane protein [Orchesella cincta]
MESSVLSSVGGMSFLFGFGSAVSTAKKKDADAFDKGVTPSLKSESGVALASRALVGNILLLLDAESCFHHLGTPRIQTEVRRNAAKNPKERASKVEDRVQKLTDLLQYVIDEDEKTKAAASTNSNNMIKNRMKLRIQIQSTKYIDTVIFYSDKLKTSEDVD